MKNEKNDLMEKIVSLCKRRGFIYPSSEIYGGLSNTWDFGPYGTELKNNIKQVWWKTFVQEREDMIGLNSSIIMNPRVWEASGHVESFSDVMIDCKKCKNRFRADHLVEEALKLDIEGKSPEEISEIINKKKVGCPTCGTIDWTKPKSFNLLFKTRIGAVENDKSTIYLRGETAQGMFVDFKQILNSSRQKIPFGIAQIGKSFRNEVTPGNFIFRTREFEIAELEYFINPKSDWKKIFNEWLKAMQDFAKNIGLKKENLRLHEIPAKKRAHYSKRTVDIEFDFPFGQKELWGLAYRTDYDLKRHEKYSGKDMSYLDPKTNKKYVPHVIEPTFGVERSLLAAVTSAYTEEKVGNESRVVMKFPKNLAPVKIAVFPLLKNKPKLVEKAHEIFNTLKEDYMCEFDDNGNIGKRYRRQDEIGTPYCITIDFDTLDDKTVTVRDRNTMKQERVKITDLKAFFEKSF